MDNGGVKKIRPWMGAAVLAAVAVTAFVVFRLAVGQMRSGIEQALGPRASVGSVSVGWSGIVLTELRVRAERPRWPAEDELRASRVQVVPELASLFSGAWRVRQIKVEGAYLSVLRRRNGSLQVVPGLVRQPRTAASTPESRSEVHIGSIVLEDASVDFFDASVRQPAHRMRFEQLDVDIQDLALPRLDEPLKINLQGVFKGQRRDGDLRIFGEVTPATRDGEISARLANVDLVALEPYLLKVNESGVRRGTLDLTLDAHVARQQLRAPGVLVLKDLELGTGGGMLGTFAGVPRQAVLASLSRDGRIELQFTLEGRLDDPRFSLNEALALRVAAGLAESLGVSLGGVVEGVGGVIKGLLGQ